MKLKTVGIKHIKSPIKVRTKNGDRQQTVAGIDLIANMPHSYRETCVDVFLSVLNHYREDLRVDIFPSLLASIVERLSAQSARVEMTFPYFIAKKAPVTATSSLMEYRCRFTGETGAENSFTLSVWVPVTTLCPCSREISRYGAHNQRAEINLNVKFKGFIWIEDLITLLESCGSCEVYALLKRPDEKHVTEKAYNNPVFVEDVVRLIAEKIQDNPQITWFSVGVESFESIHKHSAYAYVDSDEM